LYEEILVCWLTVLQVRFTYIVPKVAYATSVALCACATVRHRHGWHTAEAAAKPALTDFGLQPYSRT